MLSGIKGGGRSIRPARVVFGVHWALFSRPGSGRPLGAAEPRHTLQVWIVVKAFGIVLCVGLGEPAWVPLARFGLVLRFFGLSIDDFGLHPLTCFSGPH